MGKDSRVRIRKKMKRVGLQAIASLPEMTTRTLLLQKRGTLATTHTVTSPRTSKTTMMTHSQMLRLELRHKLV